MNKIFNAKSLVFLFFCASACVGDKLIDLPMSEEESAFYQSLEQVDSVEREIRQYIYDEREIEVHIRINVRTDNLSQPDRDHIAEQVIKFNSNITLDGWVKFDRCDIAICYHGDAYYWYLYEIKDSRYERL